MKKRLYLILLLQIIAFPLTWFFEAHIGWCQEIFVRDDFADGVTDGQPVEWRYRNFDGQGSMDEGPGYLEIREDARGVVGAWPYALSTGENLETVVGGFNWSLRTKFEMLKGSYWGIGIGMMPDYNITSISDTGFFKLHHYTNIFDSVQLPVDSMLGRDVWLQLDLITEDNITTMIASAWFPEDPEEVYELEHIFPAGSFSRTRLPYLVASDAAARFDEAILTNMPPLEFTESTSDCSGDGDLDVLDLACVTSTEHRDAILAALNTLPGDIDGDGEVQFDDFVVLASNFGQDLPSYTDGNLDLAGGVDFADFVLLADSFGKTPSDVAAVPEPTSVALLVVGFGFLGVYVCRRRSASG